MSGYALKLSDCCIDCQALDLKKLPYPFSLSRTMVLCGTCGNKRCPKASNHENDCTDSNELGQDGSYYQ